MFKQELTRHWQQQKELLGETHRICESRYITESIENYI